jgi:hypothetical protein
MEQTAARAVLQRATTGQTAARAAVAQRATFRAAHLTSDRTIHRAGEPRRK